MPDSPEFQRSSAVTKVAKSGSAGPIRARFLVGLMLQTLPAEPEEPGREVAEASGFSLHAGIAAKASQRDKVERLARYVSRPPVAIERLSLTQSGQVRYALTCWQDCQFARL